MKMINFSKWKMPQKGSFSTASSISPSLIAQKSVYVALLDILGKENAIREIKLCVHPCIVALIILHRTPVLQIWHHIVIHTLFMERSSFHIKQF